MTITFTRKKLKALTRRYNEAVEKKEEQFVFEGSELLTAYAKYLIQYLESQFK